MLRLAEHMLAKQTVSNQTLHPLHYDNEVQAGVLSETPHLAGIIYCYMKRVEEQVTAEKDLCTFQIMNNRHMARNLYAMSEVYRHSNMNIKIYCCSLL
ncbi:hypothetical protein EB796_021170 [Bugula neritina]|uniref:Uncharacterized protein n=1 Tax=Bugula neritina TaxID=10212 RepID=A0A7J7J334_BUGNE|nr:hypothetical protein EB796_021170 [Bugula neritina]